MGVAGCSTCACSPRTHPHEVEIAATGDKGKALAFEPADEFVLALRDGSTHMRKQFELDSKVREAGFHHGSTYFEHLAFQRALGEGSKPEVSVEDGIWAVLVGAAAERSIRTGNPVELSELGW